MFGSQGRGNAGGLSDIDLDSELFIHIIIR
jgi:predicted nucleotidyltransferase